MAKTNKLRKPAAVAAAGLHSYQPSAKAAAAKTGATARQPAEQQPDANTTSADGVAVSHLLPAMAKPKKLRKPAVDAAAGQHSDQPLAGAEAVKSTTTDRQPADQQADANTNSGKVNPSGFSVFISDMEASPSFTTKNDAPNATASRSDDKQPTTDTTAVNTAKKSVSFAGLFSNNRKLTDDNKLSKFAVDDGPLTLGLNDLLDVRSKLGFCLVGYIVGKFSGLKAIRALSQSWGSSFQ
ncbi:UNVERIFIED_CONTAM: hypothetical protein Sindi_1974400 [Sesamum indicum]